MSDPFSEVFGPLGRLRARMEAVFAEHGLRVETVAYAPSVDPIGPHQIQVFATLQGERPPADEEFRRVLREAHAAEVDAKAETASAELREQLRQQDGFL